MKILVYGNRKQDDEFYDISTPEKENAAYLTVFKVLDEDWEVYQDLGAGEEALLLRARVGDPEAAKRLMKGRRHYEYENVYEAELIDASVNTLKPKEQK